MEKSRETYLSKDIANGMRELSKLTSKLEELKDKKPPKLSEKMSDFFDKFNALMEENKLLKKENAALKIGKDIYRHCDGNEYTVLFDNVVDEAKGINALHDVVYVGTNGVRWRRPAVEFYGYRNGVRRFLPIKLPTRVLDKLTRPARVLLLTSYCDPEEALENGCCKNFPCRKCLEMCNIVNIPAGTVIEVLGGMRYMHIVDQERGPDVNFYEQREKEIHKAQKMKAARIEDSK